jgi:Kef-type K+ transport system membrane component KefB
MVACSFVTGCQGIVNLDCRQGVPRESAADPGGKSLIRNPGTGLSLALLFVLSPATAYGTTGGGHADPVAPVLLALAAILVAAKLGSELFERMGMPAVLGELVAGIVVGNLVLVHPSLGFFEPLRTVPLRGDWPVVIDALARIGVIILLFEVGLESTVKGMLQVGASSLAVALLGVAAPFVLGYGVSWLFVRELPASLKEIVPAGFGLSNIHMFVGAVLCATSVGITARVFKDLGRLQTKEARIILGAAVIDDVLGLMILAVVSGIVLSAESGQPLDPGSLFRLVAVAGAFLVGSLVIGVVLVPRVMNLLARLRTAGVMLVSALTFAFVLSYLANAAGLAAIVGAFAAGLLLEEVHFKGFREEIHIEQLLRPIATLFVPVFFVLMGIQVRLETFANPSVLGVAAGLTLAAIAGKQVCGLGALGGGLDRVSIGVGMIPRGEVGLIFAQIGKGLKVVDDALFSAIVFMVVFTTLSTPPLLRWTLARKQSGQPPA